ncbi:hypothetical protein [Burkholderia cepacia]|uniref:hypothetical protein n=1 Tax=Burkholderia cepacia TaxID=292 RepID=UPI0009BFC5AB|nr:hypothetical protein [Burkholderia cepacia]
MKPLARVQPPPQYETYLEQIRVKKKAGDDKQQLTNNWAAIVACYGPFLASADNGTLDQLAPMAVTPELARALRSCYGRNKGAQTIKDAIKASQPARQLKYCPMCGTTLPSTHDHYLPASRFPEFAVHPLNLVPCCAKCNSTKDADWLDSQLRRQYLHFYSDSLPPAPFLRVTLYEAQGLTAVGAFFSITRPAGVALAQWNLITSHFKRLSLIKLYNERANDEIDEILKDCAIHLRNGGRDATAFLQDQAQDAEVIWGLNHWRAVLMNALANSAKFEVLVAAKMTR